MVSSFEGHGQARHAAKWLVQPGYGSHLGSWLLQGMAMLTMQLQGTLRSDSQRLRGPIICTVCRQPCMVPAIQQREARLLRSATPGCRLLSVVLQQQQQEGRSSIPGLS